MSKDSESLTEGNPSQEMMAAWGSMNYIWARLDIWTTGALCTVIGADAVEIGILVGQQETLTKLNIIQRILKHRKDNRQKLVADVIKILNGMRPQRNAVTHGHYHGLSERGEAVFSVPTSFLIGDGPTAAPLVAITLAGAVDHIETVGKCAQTIMVLFGVEKSQELLSLPIRVPSYSPPKPPRKRAAKSQESIDPILNHLRSDLNCVALSGLMSRFLLHVSSI